MKKLICIILALAILIPLFSFSILAEGSDWNYLCAKYSSNTKNIIAPKSSDYQIKTEGFTFTESDGKIAVHTASYEEFGGAFGVSAIASKKTLPLEGLSLVIEPDDFDFTQDTHYRSNNISVIWSDKPVTEIAGGLTGGSYTTGLYESSRMTSGGLRNIVAPDTKGLCVTLSNTNGNNVSTKTATAVSIIYYDGSYTDENGNLGYCWTFTRSPADGASPLVDPSVKATPYEEIDLTNGLIISIISDPKLGYLVNINGKSYFGENAGYRNSDISDIDLSALENISSGYITVGAVSNDDKYLADHACDYTLSYINAMSPLELWGAVPENPDLHEHSYTESRTEPGCEVDGSNTYTCDCGHSYSTVIPATGHTEGRRVDTTPGHVDVYCLVCDEYMYTKSVFIPHPHFDDVKESHWFYDSVSYVISKGYMYGMNETSFSPNTELTREQFVTILANIAGVDTDAYKDEQLMSDVKPGYWFAGSVNWAVKEGYVAGVSEGVFGVGQPIQRAALARLLYLYAERNGKVTEEKSDLSAYTDFDKVQDWMAEGLGWTVKHGIITSINNDELVLAPTSTATRAQCARMLTVYDSVPDKKAEAILPEIPLEYEPDPDPVDPDPVDPDPVDPDPVDPDPVDPDPVDPDPVDPDPVPEFEPLTVNTEALKEQLVGMGMKNALGDYCFKKLNTSIAYDEENDILYAHYGAGLRYYFGSDTVEILGPGNVRPLFEIYNDYELLLRYQVVVVTAQMTPDGIIGAPEEYKSLCDDFYDDLIYILEMLNVLR